ncbi:MAG TPA: hypothetical protein VG713_00850 [Pirellulales bacterium]|nr:hypothetical protein [Pirellulales bacterium]
MLGNLFKKHSCGNSCGGCCDTGCGGCCGGAPAGPAPAAGGDGAPMPPAPMADPSASYRGRRGMVQASRSVVRN